MPPRSTNLNAATPRSDGTAIHRVPCESSQLASAPASTAAPATDTLAIGPACSIAESNTNSFPPPAATTASRSFHWNTSGDEPKSAFATATDAFSFSVLGSSAINEFDNGAEPFVVVTYMVPSRPSVGPAAPAIVAPPALNATTVLCGLVRSMAQTASGWLPQPCVVAMYATGPAAAVPAVTISPNARVFAGRNSAGVMLSQPFDTFSACK